MKIFLKKILRGISPLIVVSIFNKLKIFFNKDDFLKVFKNNDYVNICDWPVDEFYKDDFFKNFPDDLKIRNTRNFVFEKL